MTAIFTESEYEIELSAVQGPAGAGLSAIPNNTLLGNTSGSTATPVARTAAQMGLQPYSANLDRLDGTVEEQRAAIGAASETSLLGLGNIKVTQKSANSGGTWGPMDGGMIAFLGNSAYLFGGWAGDPYNADWTGGTVTNLVYRSNDFGGTWVRIRDHDLTPDATHFTPGHFMSHVNHVVGGTEYIYLMEGDVHNNGAGPGSLLTGDTRRTTDGITWTKVNSAPAGWATIVLAAAGSLNGNLYRVGGVNTPGGTIDLVNANNVRSVWRSIDNGANWTNLGNAPWPVGCTQDRLPLHNGLLWRLGGGTYDNDGSLRTYDNSVWSFDGTTWTQVLANGLAPWAPRTFASAFSFAGWLWLVRGANASGNLGDSWRSRDGITWIETELPGITTVPSHADGLGVHATGFLVASGNGYFSGSPTNADSPSFFVEIEDDKTAGVIEIASNSIEALRPLNVGIDSDSYTESSNPRALLPGTNAKIKQICIKNKDEGQPDISMIAGYASTSDIQYVYIGGGIDNTKECAQWFSVFLGPPGTLNGEQLFTIGVNYTLFAKSRIGIGVIEPAFGLGIDAAMKALRFGADEASTANPPTRTANAAKILRVTIPNYANDNNVQVFGAYAYSSGRIVYFGGGMSFEQPADIMQFYTSPGSGGTLRMQIDSEGIKINDGGTMKLIQIGAADSGGTGFKMLRIAN